MADDNEDMTDIYVGGIPKKTQTAVLLQAFNDFSCKIDHYRVRPYAFLKCPNDKLDALLAKEHKIGDTVLEVNVARDAVEKIKYFLDTRMTKGSLNDIDEEVITEYFSKFGEVLKVRIIDGKGFGFLDMKKDEDNEKVSGLAWATHEVDGHTINVKEQPKWKPKRNKRKRKWGGKGGWKKNKKK